MTRTVYFVALRVDQPADPTKCVMWQYGFKVSGDRPMTDEKAINWAKRVKPASWRDEYGRFEDVTHFDAFVGSCVIGG